MNGREPGTMLHEVVFPMFCMIMGCLASFALGVWVAIEIIGSVNSL